VGIFRKLTGKHIKNKTRNELYIAVRGLIGKTVSQPIWVGIYTEEWADKLDIEALFRYQEEKFLLRNFLSKNLTVFASHSGGFFDLGIGNNGELQSIIEVTNYKPSERGGNSIYGSVGSNITAKLQTIRLWCIKNKKKGFLILNENWSKFEWIKVISKEARREGCFILFSNFQEYDFSRISSEILKNIGLF
jgi:hypothetical protein